MPPKATLPLTASATPSLPSKSCGAATQARHERVKPRAIPSGFNRDALHKTCSAQARLVFARTAFRLQDPTSSCTFDSGAQEPLLPYLTRSELGRSLTTTDEVTGSPRKQTWHGRTEQNTRGMPAPAWDHDEDKELPVTHRTIMKKSQLWLVGPCRFSSFLREVDDGELDS
jgi:hypothetical protein